MATTIKRSAQPKPPPSPSSPRLVIDCPDMTPKRASVRFDAAGTDPHVSTFYLMKSGWEALGSPEGVRVTIEPLT